MLSLGKMMKLAIWLMDLALVGFLLALLGPRTLVHATTQTDFQCTDDPAYAGITMPLPQQSTCEADASLCVLPQVQVACPVRVTSYRKWIGFVCELEHVGVCRSVLRQRLVPVWGRSAAQTTL